MKRSIINALNEMDNKLSSLSAKYTYQYMNQCVKAEEMSLLGMTFNIEGEEKYIEEVAQVVKPDDYTFIVIPNFEEDLQALVDGFTDQHSEFTCEQEEKTVTVDLGKKDEEPRDVTVKYLKLTMPAVDDDRKSTLNTNVNSLYAECTSKMSMVYQTTLGLLNQLLEGENDTVKSEAKSKFEAIMQKWKDHRKQVYTDKINEIIEGYDKQKYQDQQENS